jgi:hypothetical protein
MPRQQQLQEEQTQGADPIGLAELVAMRRIPDHHAKPLRIYAGDDSVKMTVAEWESLYEEMMLKPTGMPQREWHETFKNKG